MEIVKGRIEFGTRRHRRAAKDRHLAESMGPLAYILYPPTLNMHSTNEDRIGPSEIIGTRWTHVLVDKADFPGLWQRRRYHQQTLRRHACAYPISQLVGIFKGGKRRGVTGKDAEDFPLGFYFDVHGATLLFAVSQGRRE